MAALFVKRNTAMRMTTTTRPSVPTGTREEWNVPDLQADLGSTSWYYIDALIQHGDPP
jgi:hypothetical protein